MREWLGEFQPGSLLILDEAHHAAPASGNRYGIETKFTRAVRDLAWRFEHRLFLSATPHNGHSSSFSTLLELLDPTRFTRGVPISGKRDLDQVMVRRIKEDIRKVRGGFPIRRIVREVVDGLPDDAPELTLSRLLDEYRTAREERHKSSSKRSRAAAGLLVVGLQQRLLSSIEAFARSLETHRKTVERQWKGRDGRDVPQPRQLEDSLREFADAGDADDERSTLTDEEAAKEEQLLLEALDAAAEDDAARDEALFKHELALLDKMQHIASGARYEPDAKMRRLIGWIREHLCPGLPEQFGKAPDLSLPWTERRVIVFTENRQGTRTRLFELLNNLVEGTEHADRRIAVLDGSTSKENRKEIQRRFNADPAREPLRILIATDAAREGLNLQAHCTDLFHFDLPWNPGRLEQRNGRIDRKLQPADEVRCHYFVLPQRVEDRVLEVLVEKTERIQQELGSLSKVIHADMDRLLAGGIRHKDAEGQAQALRDASLSEDRKKSTEEELEAARDREAALEEQIARCERILEKSETWIRFRPDAFREALSCSLRLQGAPPLREEADEDGNSRYVFPTLDRAVDRDPSWKSSLDTLRVPRRPKQKLAEWRKEAPIRPVVFADTGRLDEDTVHLHLQQRVAQRLLSRFRSQGFLHHDLSRACLAQASDTIPRVVLLGRLALYGSNAERLHEEIIPVAARWVEPEQRKAPLKPYARDAEANTLQLLEDALAGIGEEAPIDDAVQQRLLSTAAGDVEALRSELAPRAEEYAEAAIEKLRARGEKEAEVFLQTLDRQRAKVQKELAKFEERESTLFDDVDEQRQYEENARSWIQRLERFDQEAEDQPERIRGRYTVRARRVEPVGLVYLWPKQS